MTWQKKQKIMTPYTYILLAAILLIVSKILDFIMTSNIIRWSNFWLKFYLVLASATFSVFAIYFLIVFAEQKIYQAINSKVVLDIYYQPDYQNHDKILRIDNRGLVDINDVHIYFTNYAFDSSAIDSHDHFTLKKQFIKYYSMRGQIPDAVIEQRRIKSGDSVKIVINNFVPMEKDFLNQKLNLQFYTIRISFRNTQNGELSVKYLFTPACTTSPDWLENNIVLYHSNSAGSGPVDTTNGADSKSEFRNFIIKNQMGLFGDSPDLLYKN
jgi:hypothetical protein